MLCALENENVLPGVSIHFFLQNAECSLQQKTEAISSFEGKTNEMMSSMKEMEER